MLAKISRVLNQPFYPWLAGIYPILYLYSENLGLVIDQEFSVSVVCMLVATTVGFGIGTAIMRNRHKSAIILCVVSLLFSLSGHIYDLALRELSITLWTILVTITLVMIVALMVRMDWRDNYFQYTRVFNLILLAMTVMLTAQTVARLDSVSSLEIPSLSAGESQGNQQQVSMAPDIATRPDIYYIIPDAYPSDAWLRDEMGFDNSEFTNALKARGFVIADHAQSNYGLTVFSLASTLNFRYIEANPTPLKDTNYARLFVADSEAARQLRQIDYVHIQLLSGWLFPSTVADINRAFTQAGPIDIEVDLGGFVKTFTKDTRLETGQAFVLGHFYKHSFLSLYLDTTLLRIVKSYWEELQNTNENAPFSPWDPSLFLATIEEIEAIVAMPEPTFAIVHLLKPHLPVTFNEHGEIIGRDWTPTDEEYIAEFRYLNSRFLRMLDTILKDSQSPPVIIFQADHGSTFGRNKSESGKLTHFNSYAAYYLPDLYSLEIPEPFTFVNTFPLVFNEIFGTQYEFQENLLIELITDDLPFKHVDVTSDFAHK